MKNILLMALLSLTCISQAQLSTDLKQEFHNVSPVDLLPQCSLITYETPSFPNQPPNITVSQVCGSSYSQCVNNIQNEIHNLFDNYVVIIHSITRCR